MDTEWLKLQFRLHPERNKAGLAEALGLGAPAISKILSGGRQIKAAEYIAMRRYFGLPVDGERAAKSAPARQDDRYVLAPLPGLAEGNAPPEIQDSWMIPARLLKSHTAAAPDQIRIFTVQEADMAPDFLP
ncbi:MAG TPA: helix-turn-helix transcriptional regulator, partial [Micavibrio sp.]